MLRIFNILWKTVVSDWSCNIDLQKETGINGVSVGGNAKETFVPFIEVHIHCQHSHCLK